MKKIIVLIAALISVTSYGQTDVATARASALGSTVNYTAIATNGSELGPIRYMQDGTGGIAAYGTSTPLGNVLRGDSVTITGPLIEFSGLLEVSPATVVTNHGQAVIQPVPLQVPITSINESIESQLVVLENVTFVQTGMFSGTSATVQVTDGVNTMDIRVNGTTDIAGTAIPTGPVSITGLVGQFNANYQIVPRDLNDIVAYVAPLFEINVLLEGTTVLHTDDYYVGSTTTTNGTIENLGSIDLIVSGALFSGIDAADFATDIVGATIAGGATQNFSITYTPSAVGSHFAALEISSNDTDENPYIINFEGAGTDNLATEPTGNPSGLTFPIIEAYTVSGQYTAGTGASDYIVLWKKGSAITGVPVDGTSYLRGDLVGDAQVAYVGPGTSFTPRGIIANQDLFFTVHAFNGQGGFENYLTTTPASGNVSSTGENIGSYYGAINSNSTSLITDLNALINPHNVISYFLYKETIMSNFEIRDTIGGQSVVTCAYSGENLIFNDPFDWSETGYSREHTMPHTWMHSYPADSPEQPEYNDQHNLYPTNLNEANIPRSNHPLGVVTGNVTSSYLDGTLGQDASGMLVYEPRDSQKGNAARAIMYMTVAYGFNFGGDVDADDQDQYLLKDWHYADLPDDYEIARNEYIFSVQGNRNPFVDSVDFACHVDFDNLEYLGADCSQASIDENENIVFTVYPNPAKESVTISLKSAEVISYVLLDMQGREISSSSNLNASSVKINTDKVASGSYLLTVQTTLGAIQEKIIVE